MGASPSSGGNPQDLVGGRPELSGKDLAISALANVGQRAGAGAGLIPALLGGLGEAYILNKTSKAANAKAIQDELARRQSQAALAKFMGNIPPEYIQAMAQANPEVLKQFITAAGENSNRGSYQQGLGEVGSKVQLQPGTTTDAMKNILPILTGYQEKLPAMKGQNLKNQFVQATMPGEIAGTNAQNQALAKYAVPTAGAKLQGMQLNNQMQGMQNRAYPVNQQQMQQLKAMQIARQQSIAKEMSSMQGLNDVLQQIDKEHADPQVFRGLSMEVLKNAPISAQGKHAAMQQIDDMTLMKMQGANAHQIMQKSQGGNPQQKKKQGLFGLNF